MASKTALRPISRPAPAIHANVQSNLDRSWTGAAASFCHRWPYVVEPQKGKFHVHPALEDGREGFAIDRVCARTALCVSAAAAIPSGVIDRVCPEGDAGLLDAFPLIGDSERIREQPCRVRAGACRTPERAQERLRADGRRGR